MPLDDEQLEKLYAWIDSIPLSKPKTKIQRDFADGVLMAEVVHHYFPKLVDLHNYVPANSVAQKLYNWETLNKKVFKRLGFQVPKFDVDRIVSAKQGIVQELLQKVQDQMASYKSRRTRAGKSMIGGDKSRMSTYNRETKPVPSSSVANITNDFSSAPIDGNMSLLKLAETVQQTPTTTNVQTPSNPMATVEKQAEDPGQQHFKVMAAVTALSDGINPMDPTILVEQKEETISQLKQALQVLNKKNKKMEQLLRLKDRHIQVLSGKLDEANNTISSLEASR
eukprot:TRINITY_DN780024_c0_g1_i1.p1 TRINITY_DN780024_c0_g1~~TRINITY_DN780024_c0_g1_i1.p1  ORF type:complete len:281 (-),score=73.08 TRINITY_DN780024_c0_g1_i1:130-972(-)